MKDEGLQAEDYRHDAPPITDSVHRNPVTESISAEQRVPGDHIGNDHQEPMWTEDNGGFQLPTRRPAQNLFNPPPVTPAFGTGLNWTASAQSPTRPDLVNFDFSAAHPYENAPMVSNIELRTIYAHLLETAGRVRAEMRERGMQVDL